jgi:hypothetical protein
MFSEQQRQDVITTLETCLIQPEQGLASIYQDLNNYRNKQPLLGHLKAKVQHFQEPLRAYLQAQQPNLTTLAIDVPFFFEAAKQTQHTLMICAMDPLPPLPDSLFWKDKSVDFQNDVGFWVPFSLIDNWEQPTGSMRSNLPFFQSLLQNYNLYITDIFKLFFRVKKPNQLVNSNAISAYTQLQNEKGENLHGAILAKEIECVKPQAIITLGNPARNQLLTINHLLNASAQTPQKWSADLQHYRWNNQTPIISAPHISGAANGAKALVLNNPAYKHLEGKYQNEKLAKIILSQLKV